MDTYPYPDPLTLAQHCFPSWMQERALTILASGGKQAAIEYLVKDSVKLGLGVFGRTLAWRIKDGRKVEVYAMAADKILWDRSRVYRLEDLADALLVKAGQLNLF